MPPAAASVDASAKTLTLIRLIRIPACCAASALPPTAKMWRPYRVRWVRKEKAVRATTISASGNPAVGVQDQHRGHDRSRNQPNPHDHARASGGASSPAPSRRRRAISRLAA